MRWNGGGNRAAALVLLGLCAVPIARADWHAGTVEQLAFGYDGVTVAFVIGGYVRTNCTCYSAWPQMACLDRTRPSFQEEFAWLLSARVRGATININVDEATCRVVAMYEIGPP